MPKKRDLRVLRNLVYVTQLGLSVVTPIALFVLLAGWLRDRFGWGDWVMLAGILLGTLCGVYNFFRFLNFIFSESRRRQQEREREWNDDT